MAVDPRMALVAAAGSGIGGLARYVVGAIMPRTDLAWPTLTVNVAGSFLLGLLVFWPNGPGANSTLRVFLAIGVLGGFTTMSAFSVDVIDLAAGGRILQAASWAVTMVVASVAAAAAGRWLAHSM